MATLATIFNRFTSNKADGTVTAAAANRPAADVYRLRTIPNEDLYFFVKTIDNTRVVREADPVAPKRSITTIVACGTAAVLLIGLLLPRASTLLNGYQIQALREQQHELVNQRASLELEEAKLVSPARLQELAKNQEFIDPAPGHVVYLTPQQDSLALNVSKK